MKWHLWYDDNTEITGEGLSDWNAAPKHGVIIVLDKRLWHMGHDYYWWEGEAVKSCKRPDLDRYLERSDGIRNMKFGRWADNLIWDTALKNTKEHSRECKDCFAN